MLEQRIEEVNKANHAFYAAFGNLDIVEMDKVWAHQEYVTCIHPGWTLRSDWPAVRDSWVLIFNNTFSMTFELTDVMVQVAGDMAWVVCVENITTHQSDEPQQAKVLATNIFERIGDEWLLIHHHGCGDGVEGVSLLLPHPPHQNVRGERAQLSDNPLHPIL